MMTIVGARPYTDQDYRRVVLHMKAEHWGNKNPTTEPDCAAALGMNPRTVRSILADADGVDFVLAGGDTQGGTYVAEFYEQADRKTRGLLSRARKLRERAERRLHYATRLPCRQAPLMNDETDEEADE